MTRLLLAAPFLCVVAFGQVSVTIDSTGAGRTYQGIGAVSAGAASRLLIDYPEPYRGQILDYLFKPNYGAALQHLKVEMGGDVDSTDGAEPSHERANGTVNCNRGYEWWLMQQAVARNPAIYLDSLMWGTAGWTGAFYSASNVQYVKDWLSCAATNGLTMPYTGIWNEAVDTNSVSAIAWIKSLKAGLVAGGYTTQVVADDSCCGNDWLIATSMLTDPTLTASVSVVSAHYPTFTSTADAKTTGKSLWASEDSAGNFNDSWSNTFTIIQELLRNYVTGKMTKTELWALTGSFYPVFPFWNVLGPGLMVANSPWSGNYTVYPSIWAIAHVTQFAQPGWRYLDTASGTLNIGSPGSGTYATLTNGSDYSVIVETFCGSCGVSQQFNFTLSNVNTTAVHVWKSNSGAQFIQQSDIIPSGGAFTFTAAPDSIYSLTTTTGQTKGAATPPTATAFPVPYVETFESYATAKTPRYLSDLVGAFETASCTARSGVCLQQVVTTTPIFWRFSSAASPASFIGNILWSNYAVTVDALLAQAGSVRLMGRCNANTESSGNISSYQLHVSNAGVWSLTVDDAGTVLASGTLGGGFGLNTWHTLSLTFQGSAITAAVDSVQIASVSDATYAAGMPALGTSGFISAQFDNFQITAPPSAAVRGGVTIRGKGIER